MADPCQACRDAENLRRRPAGTPARMPAQHGTASKYKNGCRCAPCTAANTEGHARWRDAVAGLPAVVVPHGAGGYRNYGCRCAVCTAANSERCREYHAERRSRSA